MHAGRTRSHTGSQVGDPDAQCARQSRFQGIYDLMARQEDGNRWPGDVPAGRRPALRTAATNRPHHDQKERV